MVKGKTKSGIEFTLNEKIKDDARFLYYITRLKNDSIEDESKIDDVYNMLKLIFGSDEGMIGFMNAVAAVHDGVCDKDVLISELNEMFEAINAKNSSSSHT